MGNIRANLFDQALYTEWYGSCKHLHSVYFYKMQVISIPLGAETGQSGKRFLLKKERGPCRCRFLAPCTGSTTEGRQAGGPRNSTWGLLQGLASISDV